jgi:succinate-semialdehyde dehydrogenase/glutarate-semialdehyde dehydrogenase
LKICIEEYCNTISLYFQAEDEKHAIELCNSSQFGLGGGVFTKDEKKGERIAKEMNVGLAFVNSIVTSSPQYPFGGVKNSGYGRECGEEGILEWVNTKSLIVK